MRRGVPPSLTLRLAAHQGVVERGPGGRRPSQRCFNCGSYSHELRECPLPRDAAAVAAATSALRASQLVNGVRPAARCAAGSWPNPEL